MINVPEIARAYFIAGTVSFERKPNLADGRPKSLLKTHEQKIRKRYCCLVVKIGGASTPPIEFIIIKLESH